MNRALSNYASWEGWNVYRNRNVINTDKQDYDIISVLLHVFVGNKRDEFWKCELLCYGKSPRILNNFVYFTSYFTHFTNYFIHFTNYFTRFINYFTFYKLLYKLFYKLFTHFINYFENYLHILQIILKIILPIIYTFYKLFYTLQIVVKNLKWLELGSNWRKICEIKRPK